MASRPFPVPFFHPHRIHQGLMPGQALLQFSPGHQGKGPPNAHEIHFGLGSYTLNRKEEKEKTAG